METPIWLDKANIKTTLDARPLLASGIHPLEQVISESAAMATGEIFEIITPFHPTPMIGKMQEAGFVSYTEGSESGVFHTYFVKV